MTLEGDSITNAQRQLQYFQTEKQRRLKKGREYNVEFVGTLTTCIPRNSECPSKKTEREKKGSTGSTKKKER